MGCNCKGSNDFEYKEKSDNNNSVTQKITKYFFKTLAFSICLVFLPLIMLAIVWFLFDILVLNKNVDLGRIVRIVAKNIKRFNEDYDEDDDDDFDEDDNFDEDDYIMLNVEDITDKTK